MIHQAKIIEVKKLADGAITIKARCCEDTSTDAWHTMYFFSADDVQKQNFDAEIEEHRKRVQNLHDAVTLAEDRLKKNYNLV